MDLLKEALETPAPAPEEFIKITFPLALFKKDFFPEQSTCTLISYQSAYIISACDPKHTIFYVEYPDGGHNEQKLPRLWLYKEFLVSLTRYKETKMNSEMYRQRSYVIRANRENLVYRIAKITGLARTEDAVQLAADTILKSDTEDAYKAVGATKQTFDEEKFKKEWRAKHG